MPERSWNDLVEEGKRLIHQEGDLAWHWGDLAEEVEPTDKTRRPGTIARLEKWSKEVGFEEGTGRSFRTLQNYRSIAHRWPKSARADSVSFKVHEVLAGLPDRFEVVKSREKWTYDEALRAAGRPSAVSPSAAIRAEEARDLLADPEVARAAMADPQIRHVVDEARPAEDRADQARRLIRDPAVARHVVQDNSARSAMAKAAKEMEESAEQRQRERAPGLVGMSDFYQATGELSRMRQAGMKSLDAMRKLDLSEDQRESLKDDHSRVRLVSEWIDSYLDSGDHSFDKELDALLREEM